MKVRANMKQDAFLGLEAQQVELSLFTLKTNTAPEILRVTK